MLSTRAPRGFCKRISLLEGGCISVGVDAHKKDYKVCVWSVEHQRALHRWTQPADPSLLMGKLEGVKSQVKVIAYEAGPTGFVLARALQSEGFRVVVAAPSQIPIVRNAPKSDRFDALQLARLCSTDQLKPTFIPTPEHEQERAIQRLRTQALGDRKRVQLRIKSLLLCHGIAQPPGLAHWTRDGLNALRDVSCTNDLKFALDVLLHELEHRQVVVKACDKQLGHLRTRRHNRRDMSLLTTIPGIGERSALEFILEMGPVGRFDSRLVVSKYQGLSPDVQSTGDKRVEGSLNLSGNRRLKTLLIEAAWRWVGHDDHARSLYSRMMHNTGRAQSAITAVARKLGIVMWAMREHGTVYERPQPLSRRK